MISKGIDEDHGPHIGGERRSTNIEIDDHVHVGWLMLFHYIKPTREWRHSFRGQLAATA
jgi:hypothetical protein